jgi:hypothetical protein
MTLPIASTLSSVDDVAGIVSTNIAANGVGGIRGDLTSNGAKAFPLTPTTGVQSVRLQFTYEIK